MIRRTRTALAIGAAAVGLASATMARLPATASGPDPAPGLSRPLALPIARAPSRPSAKRTVAALPAGKPVAPIGIEHRLLGVPAVGGPIVVELTVRPQAPMSDGRVELRASEGLSIGGPVAVALPELPPGGGSAVAVIVTPLVADRHYLSVLVTGVVGGREHARAVMVPIGPAAAPAAARGPGEGSRAIRSLPMTETVH